VLEPKICGLGLPERHRCVEGKCTPGIVLRMPVYPVY
jgi:hypothetical protein